MMPILFIFLVEVVTMTLLCLLTTLLMMAAAVCLDLHRQARHTAQALDTSTTLIDD